MTPLTNLWTTVVDFWTRWSEPIILGTGGALTILVVFLLWRFIRTSNKSKLVSTLAAVVVMAWTSEGLLAVAVRKFDLPVGFAAMTFFVFEAMMLAAALKSEEQRKEKGTPGAAGGYVFVIAFVSGVVASFGAHNVGEVVLRVILPPLSVGLWWVFLVAERPGDKAEWKAERGARAAEQDARWTLTPRTVLVAVGLMKPGQVTITEAQRQRRVARVTDLGYALHVWPAWTPPYWWAKARLGRVGKHVDDPMVDEAEARVIRAAGLVKRIEAAASGSSAFVVPEPGAELESPEAPELPVSSDAEVPAEVPVSGSGGSSAPHTPEVPAGGTTGTSGADFRKQTRRGSGGSSARKNGRQVPEPKPRRSAEETRQIALELAAKQPPMTKVDIAKQIGISDRRLRDVLKGDTAAGDDEDRDRANGHKPAFAEVA